MGKNAIVQRIEQLSDQWHAFASARDARLLCWQLAHNELSMLEAFFQCEADEQTAEHPDLFVPVNRPFDEPAGHGAALAMALAEEYAQSRDELHAQDLDGGWQPPVLGKQERGVAPLVRTCASLREHHELPGKLVLILRPEGVKDGKAYQAFLLQLADEAPEWLRVIVLDELERPAYRELLRAHSPKVTAVRAELDMPGALQQLSNEAGHLDTPGGQFRDLFLRLTKGIGEGDLAGAMQLGDEALAHVGRHGLWHLGVPIHFALASGLLAASRPEEAASRFAAAEAAALRGEQEGAADTQVVCKTLRLQSRLGHGAALLTGKQHARAARCFDEAAPLATELGDQRGALDCHRLACFGWERAGEHDEALRAGRAGLAVARAMDGATLESSTFEYLAKGLLRVTSGLGRREARREVERELAALRAPRPSDPPGESPEPTGARERHTSSGERA